MVSGFFCYNTIFLWWYLADGDLSNHLTSVEEAFARHLFIISGTPASDSRLYGRAADEMEDTPFSSFTKQNINAPRATGGILKRYQLLTPALIISLLVVFFVFVPILYVGISALASVQNSVRLDAPKVVSQEKKNQWFECESDVSYAGGQH